jgi:voltage-gated potassium channel
VACCNYRFLAILIIVLGSGAFIGCIANATEMMLLQREFKQRMKKQNIVLGIFFSELGYHLQTLFSS